MQKVIGLVHTRLSPTGGVENYINKLVTSLLKKNWRIHYFTSRVSQSIPPGMTIHKVHVIRGTSVSRMLSFAYGAKKAAIRSKLPLIMGFGRTIYQDIYRDGSGCFLDYKKHSPKRFGRLYSLSYQHLEHKRFCDRRLKKIICISNMVKNQILNHYDLAPEKIDVVYNGVNSKQFNISLKADKNRLRTVLNINKDDFVILFIGNGFKRKGLEHLIKGVSRLPANLSYTLLVAGKEKKTDTYKHMAAQAGCLNHIRFLGYQKDTPSLYGAADLFVLPSAFDPFASVIIESLSSGTPVITGRQVGAAELITHGENGFIVQDYTPDTLADAMGSFLKTPDKIRMSQKAHETAQLYSWDRHMDAMEREFFQVLENKPHAHLKGRQNASYII
jgi:UDP-glucose:(heptosyl)LPS alpha-1,3-glucosyltransferase